MSTIVCRNLESCFEQSQHRETTSLKLKVAPPHSTTVGFSMLGSDHIPEVKENLEITGWSSLQNLSSTKENNTSYIHPFERKSPSKKISLELCTENLGSETGTDISDCSIFSNSSSSTQNAPEKLKQKSRNFDEAAAAISCSSFPPPLTTISGSSNPLQVRRHCEGGRLIIEAVETEIKPTHLQAERSNGRLRLSFFQDCNTKFDPQTTHDEEESDERDNELEDGMDESDGIDGEEIEICEIESEQDDDDVSIGQGQAADVEMGMETFQRFCSSGWNWKESEHGDKGLCNWKPAHWVAIS